MTAALARVETILRQFDGQDRPQAVTLALRQLGQRVAGDLVLASSLAWEAHEKSYWSLVKDAEGRPYESEEAYFESVLNVRSWRTAAKQIAVGRVLAALPEAESYEMGEALAGVGIAKAAVLVPALEKAETPAARQAWIEEARSTRVEELQQKVSGAGEAKPRGGAHKERETPEPGEKFRRYVVGAMPDLESRAVAEQFFEVGARIAESKNAVGILIAGMMECLGSWTPRAARAPKSAAAAPAPTTDSRSQTLAARAARAAAKSAPRGKPNRRRAPKPKRRSRR